MTITKGRVRKLKFHLELLIFFFLKVKDLQQLRKNKKVIYNFKDFKF